MRRCQWIFNFKLLVMILHYYQNSKGYLTKDSSHTDRLWMAHFTINPDFRIQALGYEIHDISLDEFRDIYSPIISEILILGDLLHLKYQNYNESMPVIKGDHKHVRNAVRNAKDKLSTFHSQIDEIVNSTAADEDKLFDVHGAYDELIKHIANLAELQDIENINKIFRAYKKDPDSINGIIKKVLR
jgi:hypothetical protein